MVLQEGVVKVELLSGWDDKGATIKTPATHKCIVRQVSGHMTKEEATFVGDLRLNMSPWSPQVGGCVSECYFK